MNIFDDTIQTKTKTYTYFVSTSLYYKRQDCDETEHGFTSAFIFTDNKITSKQTLDKAKHGAIDRFEKDNRDLGVKVERCASTIINFILVDESE